MAGSSAQMPSSSRSPPQLPKKGRTESAHSPADVSVRRQVLTVS